MEYSNGSLQMAKIQVQFRACVKIDQQADHKANVTIGKSYSMRHYQFVKTEQGWKPTVLEIE